MLTIACCFVDDGSKYPNAAGGGRAQRLLTYWRCIQLLFHSVRLSNPNNVRCILFTPDPLPFVDVEKTLSALGVEVIPVPFTFAPPPEFYDRFRGALYLFDALKWVSTHGVSTDRVLFLDPDCLVVRSLETLDEELSRVGAIVYPVAYPPKQAINGLSRVQIGRLAGEFDPSAASLAPCWVGGEFLALTHATCISLSSDIDSWWRENMIRARSGMTTFNTEEHLLSALIALSDRDVSFEGDYFVKRMWTARNFRNTDNADVNVPIWHVPAEKTRGLGRLYKEVMRRPERWDGVLEQDRAQEWASYLGLTSRTKGFVFLLGQAYRLLLSCKSREEPIFGRMA